MSARSCLPPLVATRVGVLGGTFNPPHRGHLALAQHARRELVLEQVLLMPANVSPAKLDEDSTRDPGPQHRLRMCQLAAAGADGVSVCALEIERGGLSYTVDTLRSLHASHPQAQLTLIVGADTVSTLGSWREPQQLLALARVAVAARAGASPRSMLDALARPTRAAREQREPERGADTGSHDADEGCRAERVQFLHMPILDISSSTVRRRVAAGETIGELVGAPVADYIAAHRLYRAPAAWESS